MYSALEVGLSVEDFWKATPRMIVCLLRERQRSYGGSDGKTRRNVRQARAGSLADLPRP